MGRLTRNPEITYSQGDNPVAIARYSLAVDRRFKKEGSEDTTDFIRCVSFGKQAEFAEKYLYQGTKICVVGRIQTGNYTNKDGQKVYTTDVVVEQHAFCESKGNRTSGESAPATTNNNEGGFIPIPDSIEEDLPFC